MIVITSNPHPATPYTRQMALCPKLPANFRITFLQISLYDTNWQFHRDSGHRGLLLRTRLHHSWWLLRLFLSLWYDTSLFSYIRPCTSALNQSTRTPCAPPPPHLPLLIYSNFRKIIFLFHFSLLPFYFWSGLRLEGGSPSFCVTQRFCIIVKEQGLIGYMRAHLDSHKDLRKVQVPTPHTLFGHFLDDALLLALRPSFKFRFPCGAWHACTVRRDSTEAQCSLSFNHAHEYISSRN